MSEQTETSFKINISEICIADEVISELLRIFKEI